MEYQKKNKYQSLMFWKEGITGRAAGMLSEAFRFCKEGMHEGFWKTRCSWVTFDLFQASVFQVGLDTGLNQLTSDALNISKEIT